MDSHLHHDAGLRGHLPRRYGLGSKCRLYPVFNFWTSQELLTITSL